MQDTGAMRCLQAVDPLPDDRQRFARAEPAPGGETFGQGFAFEQLHYEETIGAVMFESINTTYARVLDGAGHSHFAQQPGLGVPIERKVADAFQRYEAASLEIVGGVYLTHAAGGNKFRDPITIGEELAGLIAWPLERGRTVESEIILVSQYQKLFDFAKEGGVAATQLGQRGATPVRRRVRSSEKNLFHSVPMGRLVCAHDMCSECRSKLGFEPHAREFPVSLHGLDEIGRASCRERV